METALETEAKVNKPVTSVRDRFRKACGPYLKNHNNERSWKHYTTVVDDQTMSIFLDFMERNDVPRGAKSALVSKLRYETPIFSFIMEDIRLHYEEAMNFRARYKREQTYSALITIVSSLNNYGTGVSHAAKSALLGATYSALSVMSPYQLNGDNALKYGDGQNRRFITIADDDLIALIVEAEDRSEDIQAMLASSITDAAKIKQVLSGNVSSAFASGIL